MMKKKWAGATYLAAILLLSTVLPAEQETVIPLTAGWKFSPCDKLEFARPDFDDSHWLPFRVDRIWEEQGFERLDGYGWYRLRLVIPAQLRQGAYLQDGLRIFLGKINNFDQAFLNGRLFGINGQLVAENTPIDESFTSAKMELWNIERVYVLPPDDPRILWDQENVIAVRVFDEGGSGGLWTGDASLRMVQLADYLALESAQVPYRFDSRRLRKNIVLKNISASRSLEGTMNVQAVNKVNGEIMFSQTLKAEVKPLTRLEMPLALPLIDQSCRVSGDFRFKTGDAHFTFSEETPYVLTPEPPGTPRINGPVVTGGRPGRPFLFAVAATGRRPLAFSASNLPPGLSMDPATGIISGRSTTAGEYEVVINVENKLGRNQRELKIVIGAGPAGIALTPPLGWNSWNCWGLAVDQDKILAAAKAFREEGLADHGWSYINIDDGWEIKGDSPGPKRSAAGDILVNEKFPDLKGLADRVHDLGLKIGIYSSPGPLTCGGYTASHGYEFQDAQSLAAWGIDYLKYDWCSYEKIAADQSRPELEKPYRLMRQALDAIDRDIVYSLCQYGMGKVWEWGATVGGNLWRTTGDINDTWQSVKEIGFSQVENAPFAGPGHWNDPDMLVVGWVGWGPQLHPTNLTPDEQYTHISLWSLLAAPLLIGCDLERLDTFTLNLLTNDEVLAVDQDPLGKQAVPVIAADDIQVWVKELADGGRAVGVFNLGEKTAVYSLDLVKIGCSGKAALRDLWRQKNLGEFAGKFTATVPAHGVKLIRVVTSR